MAVRNGAAGGHASRRAPARTVLARGQRPCRASRAAVRLARTAPDPRRRGEDFSVTEAVAGGRHAV